MRFLPHRKVPGAAPSGGAASAGCESTTRVTGGRGVASGGVTTDTGQHHDADCVCDLCVEDRDYDNEVMWGLFEARGHIDH